MTTTPSDGTPFRYEGYVVEPTSGTVSLRYALGTRIFEERFEFDPAGNWEAPGIDRAIQWLFLLAGVSYYKTAPTRAIDLGEIRTTSAERAFLALYYREGLGEFAYRNTVDLSLLRIEGPDHAATAVPTSPRSAAPPGAESTGPRRPLVPFGGGIDSIVTMSVVREIADDLALFVVSPSGARFEAIEGPAAVSGLPVVRVERRIDPILKQGDALGFLNGHVPVTGILSAAAVVAACIGGRDGVVMSNEHSASVPTSLPPTEPPPGQEGLPPRLVNHQWSKGVDFERGYRAILSSPDGPRVDYFSLLRGCSELWVATRFAMLPEYHASFRSCNRAFHLDPAERLDHWCGTCDKCCFIDLVLAPFLSQDALREIFDGTEPFDRPELEDHFRGLLGIGDARKPFECVGDVRECRVALRATAMRRATRSSPLFRQLVIELDRQPDPWKVLTPTRPSPNDIIIDGLLVPAGEHFLPEPYAAALG